MQARIGNGFLQRGPDGFDRVRERRIHQDVEFMMGAGAHHGLRERHRIAADAAVAAAARLAPLQVEQDLHRLASWASRKSMSTRNCASVSSSMRVPEGS